MKKSSFFLFLILVCLVFGAYKTYYRKCRLKSIGYTSCFKRHKGRLYDSFKRKISSPPPLWAQEQIARDLRKENITLASLQATHQVILRGDKALTNRYRIVNQVAYRYLDEELEEVRSRWDEEKMALITWFEDSLRTLLVLTRLPDMDFIITHADGTQECFYQTEDPKLQAPIFGWAKLKTVSHMILIPDWRSLSFWWDGDIRRLVEGKSFLGKKVPWEEKKQIAFWRGGLTESLIRMKIAHLSLQYPDLIDAGITSHLSLSDPCRRPLASYEEHLHCKYLPVLDGVMCSYPGVQWRLLSDGVCFKQESDQLQWFYGALKPYEHYVPIQRDLSDLVDQVIWAKAHDEECKQMALNATHFMLSNMMMDDIYVYLYHALTQYSALQDEVLKKEIKKTPRSSCWACL